MTEKGPFPDPNIVPLAPHQQVDTSPAGIAQAFAHYEARRGFSNLQALGMAVGVAAPFFPPAALISLGLQAAAPLEHRVGPTDPAHFSFTNGLGATNGGGGGGQGMGRTPVV